MKNQENIPIEISQNVENVNSLKDNTHIFSNISENINYIKNSIDTSKENFISKSIKENSEIPKNSIYFNNQSNEDKNQAKLISNIPDGNAILEIIKESFPSLNNNLSEMSNNVSLINNENLVNSKINFKSNNTFKNQNQASTFIENFMNSQISNIDSAIKEREISYQNIKNENIYEFFQMLASMNNFNVENIDENTLNSILMISNSMKKNKEVDENQNLLENFVNNLNQSKTNENKKENNIHNLKESDFHLTSHQNTLDHKNISTQRNVKTENNQNVNDYNEKDVHFLHKNQNNRDDLQLNSEKNILNDIREINKPLITDPNSIASMQMLLNPNLLYSLIQNKDFSNLNLNINNPDELHNNLNALNLLFNPTNLTSSENQKFQGTNNSLSQSINYQNLSNPLNTLINPSVINSTNEAKLEVSNSIVNTSAKGSINFHINIHFHLNLITPNISKNHTGVHTINGEGVGNIFNEHTTESNKDFKMKDENYNLISNSNGISNLNDSNNQNMNFTKEIEDFCNKYNNKMIDNGEQGNMSCSANVANFNSVLSKNVFVNSDPKFSDYIYYLTLLNNPEMNGQLLNFIKSNFDINKIGEEYKHLIFNVTGLNNMMVSEMREPTNSNHNLNLLPTSLNNTSSINGTNNNNNHFTLLLNSLIGNNNNNLISGGNNNPVVNQPNLLNLNDQNNFLQSSQNLTNISNVFGNQEFKNDNSQLGLLNNLYNIANLNNMGNNQNNVKINSNDKNMRINTFTNDNINDLRGNAYLMYNNGDKDLINELNNFNKLKNNNISNGKNQAINNMNNKNTIFLSNKTKRKNSNFSGSGDNLNSIRQDGKNYDSNYCSNGIKDSNYEDINENDDNFYKQQYSITSDKNNNQNARNDDIYDFLKTKKFHIKKCNRNEQSQNQSSNNLVNTISNSTYNLNTSNIQNLPLPEKSNKENRKFKADSIHKKIKVNVLKYLKATICEFIPNKRVNNLSQEIITNVNISFNKELLEKQLYKIYEDDYLENNGLECLDNIKKAMYENREFFELMNLTLKDFITYKYWKSDFHKKKLTKIFQQESYEYYVNYEFLDKEFINYFLNNKGNKRKILKNKKLNSDDGKSEYSITASNA